MEEIPTLFVLAAKVAMRTDKVKSKILGKKDLPLVTRLSKLSHKFDGQPFGGYPRSLVSNMKTKDLDIQFSDRIKMLNFEQEICQEFATIIISTSNREIYSSDLEIHTFKIMIKDRMGFFTLKIDMVCVNQDHPYAIKRWVYDFDCNTLALDESGQIIQAFESRVDLDKAIQSAIKRDLILHTCMHTRNIPSYLEKRVSKMEDKGFVMKHCSKRRCWNCPKIKSSKFWIGQDYGEKDDGERLYHSKTKSKSNSKSNLRCSRTKYKYKSSSKGKNAGKKGIERTDRQTLI